MINELKRGRNLLNSVYAMDDPDRQALEDSKIIMVKASAEIVRLQEELDKR